MTPGQFVNAVLAANAAAREQQVLLGNSDTAIYMQAPPPDVENMNDAIEPDETWNFIQDVIISGGLDFGAPIVKSLFTDAAPDQRNLNGNSGGVRKVGRSLGYSVDPSF